MKEDLWIDTAQMEGYVSEQDGDVTVVLDTNLTPELLEEGFIREIISKIQTMRKEAGFEVTDKISVTYEQNVKIAELMTEHADEIKSEVLAVSLSQETVLGYTKEWNINGEKVLFGVERQ